MGTGLAGVQLLIVPGLRDDAPLHWQTLLAGQWPGALALPPLGRAELGLAPRLRALEAAVEASRQPVLLVAHSGGCVLVAHWAARTRLAGRIRGALLATPPTFDAPLPPGYPRLEDLDAHGWLPVPRAPLPFPALVAASRNDPLGAHDAVLALARDWGAATEDLGLVGHLNPASGYGLWPGAITLIEHLAGATAERVGL